MFKNFDISTSLTEEAYKKYASAKDCVFRHSKLDLSDIAKFLIQSRTETMEVEKEMDDKGRIKYKRVGVVKPVASKIWDNRFMAKEEGAFGANFGCTTFVRVSGKKPVPGHLLREIVK